MTHPSRTPFIAPALPLWQQALLESRESLPEIAMEKERAGANVTETLGAPGFTLQAQHQAQAALPPGQKIGSGTLGVHPAGTGWVNIGLASTLRPVCRAPSTQELRCYIDLINYSSPKAQKLQRDSFCSPCFAVPQVAGQEAGTCTQPSKGAGHRDSPALLLEGVSLALG